MPREITCPCYCLFSLFIFIVYLVFNEYGVWGYENRFGGGSFVPTNCTILNNTIIESYCYDHDTKHPCLRLLLTVNYTVYSRQKNYNLTSTINDFSYNNHEKANADRAEYPPSSIHRCYYNVAHPKTVHLEPKRFREPVIWALVLASVGIVFILLKYLYKCYYNSDCHGCKEFYYNLRFRKHDTCIICFDAPKTVVLNCGHHLYCYSCARQQFENRERCPYCQKRITRLHTGITSSSDWLDPALPFPSRKKRRSTKNRKSRSNSLGAISLPDKDLEAGEDQSCSST